ncbi:MAG: DNA topoisomerase III [Staphylococcus equorum]|uniref:DNA topoisomerase III n=1 Tax=Staphylococcus TaxID=1279 RepID=UPI000623BF73|nr:DNA topoisomerase III [Staphylococcus equorum]KKI53091.1 DNA topoisomerase III [Staphylococcus equorum subsp. equorum]MDG0823118.1 DNA topoisomerase III [Staphylococcus equorum]MDG0836380.1 DNA topoisomerase III [Staphylococcus equorum]MDK9872262.1 DNA topoisomerase III [Staphylococcus equorum]MDK9878022.1 DNA topoisomerase III [Staphylococcus equorum]
MKSLIIAEKPSVGRDIANTLNVNEKRNGYFENNKYIVTWALGHLVTNATPEQYDNNYKEWKLDVLPIIPNKMKTVVISKTRKQFSTVQSLIKNNNVKDIIIATDAGREGELVARLILDKAHNQKPIKRLWISSVTNKAIKDGFNKLQDGRKYDNLYHAALARSEADWIVGINATRALTTKYDAQLSLGRVQTPTIQLVQMRQNEINQFKPQTYFTMKLNAGGLNFQCTKPQSHPDKTVFEGIKKEIEGQVATIETITKSHKKSYPQQLFSLTDLQQEAYKRYHLGPKETLNTLQALYERHKLVTYPRTDSNYLTDDMVDTLKDRLQAIMATTLKDIAKGQMSQSFSAKQRFVNNSKVSDHHAIIPTEVRPDMNQLSQRESKIYMMIAQRYLENLMPPHEYEAVSIELSVGGYNFTFKDKITTKLGFKAVYDTQEKANEQIAQMQKGATLKITRVNIEQHETTPPAYFNEGTLLKAMESPQKFFALDDKKHNDTLKETGGIGTVATRADIIEKLFNMNAIEARDGKIKVTSKGKQILELAPKKLTSPLLTAEWEEKLSLIEQGKYDVKQFISEMKQFTNDVVSEIKESEQSYKHDNLTTTECPTCSKFMIKVKTKNGQMLVCQDPTCKTKKNVQRKTNARCPNCHKKMTLFGRGKDAVYRCVCGHTESQTQMDKRHKNKKSDKINKKDMKKYMNKDEGIENNPFQDALKGLKF